MSKSNPDRDLLFGVIALRMNLVSQAALLTAVRARRAGSAKPMGQMLVDLRALPADLRACLEVFVEGLIQAYGGDAGECLAGLPPLGAFRNELEKDAGAVWAESVARLAVGGETLGEASSTANRAERFVVLDPRPKKGGRGEVYRAKDAELPREVAVKRIQVHLADDPKIRRQFIREAEITGSLEHPAIVPIYGLGRDEKGRPFYAMRYIEGEQLTEAIARFHKESDPEHDPGAWRLGLCRLLETFLTVCEAVGFAHSKGVIHRDLKPGNILLGHYGETFVVDWGLARRLDREAARPDDDFSVHLPAPPPDVEEDDLDELSTLEYQVQDPQSPITPLLDPGPDTAVFVGSRPVRPVEPDTVHVPPPVRDATPDEPSFGDTVQVPDGRVQDHLEPAESAEPVPDGTTLDLSRRDVRQSAQDADSSAARTALPPRLSKRSSRSDEPGPLDTATDSLDPFLARALSQPIEPFTSGLDGPTLHAPASRDWGNGEEIDPVSNPATPHDPPTQRWDVVEPEALTQGESPNDASTVVEPAPSVRLAEFLAAGEAPTMAGLPGLATPSDSTPRDPSTPLSVGPLTVRMGGKPGPGLDRSRKSGAPPSWRPRDTEDDAVVGTPGFMSPEQAGALSDRMGPASDIYSLGSTLFGIIAGKPAYEDKKLVSYLKKVRTNDFPHPRVKNKYVPRPLEAICLKAMALEPANRYPSTEALANDIRKWIADEPVSVYREPPLLRARRWVRRHRTSVTTSGSVGAVLLVGAIVTWVIFSAQTEANAARNLVDRLVAAPIGQTLSLAAQFPPHAQRVRPLLESRLSNPILGSDVRSKLRVGLLLLDPSSRATLDALAAHLLDANAESLPVLAQALAPHVATIAPRLMAALEDRDPSRARQRFNAACALAGTSLRERIGWSEHSPFLARMLVEQPTTVGKVYLDALRPVGAWLKADLRALFLSPETTPPARSVAADTLIDYAESDVPLIAHLLTESKPFEHAGFLKILAQRPDESIRALSAILDETVQPQWPLGAGTSSERPGLSSEIETAIRQAEGLIEPSFVLVQTLPQDRFEKVDTALKAFGYSPSRLRPFLDSDESVKLAALWLRDGVRREAFLGLESSQLPRDDSSLTDPAVYVARVDSTHAIRYSFIRRHERSNNLVRVVMGRPDEVAARERPLKALGFVPRAASHVLDPSDPSSTRCVTLWVALPSRLMSVPTTTFPFSMPLWLPNLPPRNVEVRLGHAFLSYLGQVRSSRGIRDVCFGPAPTFDSTKLNKRRLAEAEARLRNAPNDPAAHSDRGAALFRLGRLEEALTSLDRAVAFEDKLPKAKFKESTHRIFRAQTLARLGRHDEALKELENSQYYRDKKETTLKTHPAIIGLFSGRFAEGLQALEEQWAASADYQYSRYTARAWAIAAREIRERQPERFEPLAARAVDLLRLALRVNDYQPNLKGFWDVRDEMEPIEDSEAWKAVVREWRFDRQVSTIGELDQDAMSESRNLEGPTPAAHRLACEALVREGFRPIALTVNRIAPGQPPHAASAWSRPVISEEVRNALARRQAIAAIALIQLGAPERAWRLLAHVPDPTCRSYLIEWMGERLSGADPLVRRIDSEADTSARRALILSLGQFPTGSWSESERESLRKTLLTLYRTDPDAGIHSAVRWLLQQASWSMRQDLAAIDNDELASLGRRDGFGWFVNRQGQTFSILRGPVDFPMGSPPWEGERDPSSEMLHRQGVDRTFAIGTMEVTIEQYRRFQEAYPDFPSPYSVGNAEPDAPISGINWLHAIAYCRWLSDREGMPSEESCFPDVYEIQDFLTKLDPTKIDELPKDVEQRITERLTLRPGQLALPGYRPATEAEWEYACRAGSVTPRPFGSDEELLSSYGWFFINASGRVQPVGLRKPNDFGLFDMLGNVLEHCLDYEGAYPRSTTGLPALESHAVGPFSPKRDRILRGGAFDNPPKELRSAMRNWLSPSTKNLNDGLRLVRTLP